jgi:hypothetical protein
MTRDEVLEVVYRFHPRGLYVDGLGYRDTEERRRQRDAMRRAGAECAIWEAMLRRLRSHYQLWNRSVHDLGKTYPDYDPAHRGELYVPGHRIGFYVSVLGPYYGIRRVGAPGEEPAALELAREIEASYPAYKPIPPELGNEVVPDVTLDKRLFGEATIYDCLLSQDWEDSSGPWPPPPRPPAPAAERVEEAASVRSGRSFLRRGDDDQPPVDDEPPDPEVDRRG